MPSWATTSEAPRSSRRINSDVPLLALPRGGQIKCFQAYHSPVSTSAPLNWRRGRGGVIRVVILRTPERREIRWISTANAPLSPIVGQSELRRVASSHDTHLDNYIISSGGGVGGGGSDGDGARGGAVTAAELEPTAVQDYPGTGTR